MSDSKLHLALITQDKWEGGRLYIENLARSLLALPSAERPRLTIYALASSRLSPEVQRGAHVVRFPTVRVPPGYGLGRLGPPARFLGTLAFSQLQHADFVYPFLCPFPIGAVRGNWIPDFQHRALPEMFSAAECRQRDASFLRIAKHSDVLVLSSEAARSDLRTFAPQYVSRTRILRFATPLAPDDFEIDARGENTLANLPARYFYIGNQFWRHKDHPTAFRALRMLLDRGMPAVFVCTGEMSDYRNPNWSKEIRSIVDELALGDALQLVGFQPRAVQLEIMARADAVIQPSLFEGWSTVVEDARALQRRIVLTSIPPHVEQAPPRSRYFPPGDAVALADALEAVWREGADALSDKAKCIDVAAVTTQRVARDLVDIASSAITARSRHR